MTCIVAKKPDFKAIEKKWKQRWANEKVFEADPSSKKKCFVNIAFPYVNGPLHLGHTFSITRIDLYARFKRMQGFNVLFPFAFHATGEPIIGVAKRLAKGDKIQKKVILESGVPEENLSKFKDPKYIARYWSKKAIESVNALGASIDWRRKFTTIDPEFNRFIEWQYNLLRRKGYVVQGTHPVVWCPNCESPTGDHDRLEGEGEGPIDYVVFKFKLRSGEILPMATLRPETIYGVTNVWVHPDAEYVKTKVDGEVWIVGDSENKKCVEKLVDQLHSVKVLGKVKGNELVGKKVINPVTKEEVLVLPATFVDPTNATGFVMSVPSHAPYDWVALKDLGENKLLSKYKINREELKKIKPISVVATEGFNEHPAIDICEEIGVKNQSDTEKLEKATNIIYKREFHKGILRENCGGFKGLPVSQCKKGLSETFRKKGYAFQMWEPTDRVICRCGTRCHIKILEKQWFLKFSDEGWKKRARECVSQMGMYPEQSRKQYLETINWLEDKACARKSGMGTKLPWDKDWIVETLSDSVIYMAYYTIAKHVYANGMEPDQLKESVYDYIFLGKGSVEVVAKESGINKDKLRAMRKEFEYWYPFDLRGSAKELIPNHLTFCIFHHTAIWKKDKWPRGFTVNGMQQMYGQKMSKSKGNFITLEEVIDKYTADAIRATLMDSSEGLEDPDWTEQSTLAWRNKLNHVYRMIKRYYNKGRKHPKRKIDSWLLSRIQRHIADMTAHLEKIENRSALTIFHLFFNDLQWYLRRSEPEKTVVNYTLETLVKLLSPFVPFICEELWEIMGKQGFVSVAEWPKVDESKIDDKLLIMEENFRRTSGDVKEVVKLSGKNKKLFLYVVSSEELDYFKDGLEFLKKENGFMEAKVFLVDDADRYDPEDKAKRAKFGKPGIYVE